MTSISHIFAGFSLGFHRRRDLRCLLDATPADNCILTLDPVKLLAEGITALALDFDGVLASHGSAQPLPEAVDWLKRCAAIFGEKQLFILSNKPTDERRRWFSAHFPAMRFIAGVRKKPYPDGLIKTAELAGVAPHAILMVDDRLLTGCLAALAAGVRPCYIRNPYSSYSHRPGAELFFKLLRVGERLFVRVIT